MGFEPDGRLDFERLSPIVIGQFFDGLAGPETLGYDRSGYSRSNNRRTTKGLVRIDYDNAWFAQGVGRSGREGKQPNGKSILLVNSAQTCFDELSENQLATPGYCNPGYEEIDAIGVYVQFGKGMLRGKGPLHIVNGATHPLEGDPVSLPDETKNMRFHQIREGELVAAHWKMEYGRKATAATKPGSQCGGWNAQIVRNLDDSIGWQRTNVLSEDHWLPRTVAGSSLLGCSGMAWEGGRAPCVWVSR